MKTIGLTGGIGSGKTIVLKEFMKRGIPCYSADERAKYLMQNNLKLKAEIKNFFGSAIFKNEQFLTQDIAKIVFSDTEKLKKLNSLVHPFVYGDFEIWKTNQKKKTVMKEAAILFESGAYKNCDIVVLVVAPKKDRIKRVIKRDGCTKIEVLNRMNNQWEDSKKMKLANYIIKNLKWQDTLIAIEKVYKDVLKKPNKVVNFY